MKQRRRARGIHHHDDFPLLGRLLNALSLRSSSRAAWPVSLSGWLAGWPSLARFLAQTGRPAAQAQTEAKAEAEAAPRTKRRQLARVRDTFGARSTVRSSHTLSFSFSFSLSLFLLSLALSSFPARAQQHQTQQ